MPRVPSLAPLNISGAAAELAGRSSQAVAAYRRALVLLEVQRARFGGAAGGAGSVGREGGGVGDVGYMGESSGNSRCAEAARVARRNLGRVLTLEGQAEDAVGIFANDDHGQVKRWDRRCCCVCQHDFCVAWAGTLSCALPRGTIQ